MPAQLSRASGALELIFLATTPALGTATYFISPSPTPAPSGQPAVVLRNEFFQLSFNPATNLTSTLQDFTELTTFALQQNLLQYHSAPQSNAYIFLPLSSQPDPVSTSIKLTVTSGPVFDESVQVRAFPASKYPLSSLSSISSLLFSSHRVRLSLSSTTSHTFHLRLSPTVAPLVAATH